MTYELDYQEPEIFERARTYVAKRVKPEDLDSETLALHLITFACEERLLVIQEANAAFVNAMHRRANRDAEPK